MRDGFIAALGEHVRVLRTDRRLSQLELADRSGVSVDTVRRIERGDLSPSLSTLSRVAAGLELTLTTLFGALESGERMLAAEVCDHLQLRSDDDVRRAIAVLRSLFDE